MATTVTPNKDYANAATVNNKYNPFKPTELLLQEADKALYGKMLTNRTALLKSMNLMPRTLKLMCPKWADLVKAETGKKPPLVIISSNRSNWIKQGVAAADAELTKRKLTNFSGVSDFLALTATNQQTSSPPIYCPKRLGANPQRSVFIVVHLSEYEKYATALAGSGMNIIGWDFERPKDEKPFVGFGASRFAAIEFCKSLRVSGKVWDYAWLIDDNVVALEYFAGLEKVEAALAADPKKVCAAFKGANEPYAFAAIKKWAPTAPQSPPKTLPPSNSYGILQQVGLWNIKLLADQFLNFPPIYLTSAEDISLNRYFNYKRIPYLLYAKKGYEIVVVKERPEHDKDGGGEVNKSRQYYAAKFAKAESELSQAQPKPPAPPPVNVVYKAVAKTVVTFVNTDLLADETDLDEGEAETLRNTAACQGVEQITKTAIGLAGGAYMDEAALTTTFKINGQKNHAVEFYEKKEVKPAT